MAQEFFAPNKGPNLQLISGGREGNSTEAADVSFVTAQQSKKLAPRLEGDNSRYDLYASRVPRLVKHIFRILHKDIVK